MIVAILRWARRRRIPVLLCTLLLTAIALVQVRSIRFDADVLHLLPKSGRAVPAFEQFLQQFGSLDYLYVVFNAPADHTIDEYTDEIDAFVARLSALPEIVRVDAGLMQESRKWDYLGDRELLMLSTARLDDALARFSPSRLPQEVARARELLSVPSPDVAAMVQQDPLGLFLLMRDQLQGAAGGMKVDAGRGGYISADNRSRLVLAKPARPPFDTDFAKTLFAQLARVEHDTLSADASPAAPPAPPAQGDEDEDARPPLRVQFAGGHRIALETEREVRAETIWNSVGSLAVILPLLFLAFRSVWLVAVGAIPSIVAMLIVLAGYATADVTLSAAATGAAAMLFGLGIDGVVLLFVAFRERVSAGASANDAALSLTPPASSMLLGMWTTAATFYGLTFIDFPSLEELGQLIGHGMVLCGLLTLILIPALLPARVGRVVPPLTSWWLARLVQRRARAILIGAAVVTAAMLIASTRLHVDASLDKLRSTTAGVALEEGIASRFGLPRDVYLVIARGGDLDALLAANERLVEQLGHEAPGMPLHAPSQLLPSRAHQDAAVQRIASAGLAPADITSRLLEASAAAGFRPGTFAPFDARLPRLLDPSSRLTYDGFAANGLGDLLSRTIAVTHEGGRPAYVLATYLYPSSERDVSAMRRSVDREGVEMTLTGLPEVNRELAARFVPEFTKGVAAGTGLVLLLLIFTFRRLRPTLLALVPTLVALVWSGGVLALAGIELDLFSVFAVMTFVGIGVDYGIHLVHRFEHTPEADRASAIAHLGPVIMVAGAITLLGFGTLVTSSYPPLKSLGVVSAVTIVTLMGSSLLVLPALLMRGRAS